MLELTLFNNNIDIICYIFNIINNMGIYPNYKSIKGIKILDWNNGVTIYEYGSESILNNEDILKAQHIYNNLPNKESIEIKVYVSVMTTYEINNTPFYEWYPIESFKELE